MKETFSWIMEKVIHFDVSLQQKKKILVFSKDKGKKRRIRRNLRKKGFNLIDNKGSFSSSFFYFFGEFLVIFFLFFKIT
jgi:hypothetical protein